MTLRNAIALFVRFCILFAPVVGNAGLGATVSAQHEVQVISQVPDCHEAVAPRHGHEGAPMPQAASDNTCCIGTAAAHRGKHWFTPAMTSGNGFSLCQHGACSSGPRASSGHRG